MNPSTLEIHDLFGTQAKIAIPLTEPFRILFGKNGSGKTTVLRVLSAILSGSFAELGKIRFSSAGLIFDGGDTLVVSKENARTIKLQHLRGTKVVSTADWTAPTEPPESFPLTLIEEEIDELVRVSPREWRLRETGETLSYADIAFRYGDRLPWVRNKKGANWPRELLANIDARFIQTQRLLTLERARHREVHARFENTVTSYANQLKHTIATALTNSTTVTQKLDSTYPRRLLDARQSTEFQLKEIDEMAKRVRLMGEALKAVGLLQEVDLIAIDDKLINENNRKAIFLYLQDTIEKYQFFNEIKDKISLFQDILARKFEGRKNVTISKENGIRVTVSGGEEIALDLLSSGEQHEIVLLFDLIFKSDPLKLSVVLIDEPEISLHVDWQMSFLDDIQRISELSGARFVIATHSPVVIGTHAKLCTEL